MADFFDYQSPYRTGIFMELNIFERLIPFVIIALALYFLYKYRLVIRENKVLDKKIRYIYGSVFLVLYSSHYILRFAIYGLDTLILPFHLCSIAMFFAIILLFTNNRTIFTFVFLAGLAGGLISLSFPITGYDSAYYRYYQFMGAHSLLLIAPFYYIFVYKYIPSGKEIRNAFLILQSLATFMMIFNYFMETDFMFLFLRDDYVKEEFLNTINKVGGAPLYILWVEIVAVSYFYGVHLLIKHLTNVKEKKQILKLKEV